MKPKPWPVNGKLLSLKESQCLDMLESTDKARADEMIQTIVKHIRGSKRGDGMGMGKGRASPSKWYGKRKQRAST